MSAEIYTMRHGKTSGRSGIFDCGDPHLLEIGAEQSYAIGITARPLDIGLIIMAPNSRTRQTADAFISGYGADIEVRQDTRAAEQNFGPLAGQKKADVYDTPDMIELGRIHGLSLRLADGVETEEEVAARIQSLAGSCLNYSAGNVLIITSGQTAKAAPAVHQKLGREAFRAVEVPHASLAPFDLNDPGIRTPIFVPPLRH